MELRKRVFYVFIGEPILAITEPTFQQLIPILYSMNYFHFTLPFYTSRMHSDCMSLCTGQAM